MKILHICLTGPYTDGWNYQENLLTKYQRIDGHDVTIIASQWQWNENGKIEENKTTNYVNSDGVRVFRLAIKGGKDVFYRYKKFKDLYVCIENIEPEIIFVHNLQFLDISIIKKYAVSHQVQLFADNHCDFSNSARSTLAKIFYKTVWRHYARKIEPFVTKFYGVLPARVDFLEKVYKLPEDKCELLVMGADDEEVEAANKTEVRTVIREKFNIANDDFLIVTGGKIDAFKVQTLYLMEAVKNINNDKVKLLVFGSIDEEIKDKVEALCDGERVQYIGWAKGSQSYEYFAAADLVVFPGRHSVFWEQAAGLGIPMICKYWEGTTHVDLGGNVFFLNEDSVDCIQKAIEKVVNNQELYAEMKYVAVNKGMQTFSYKRIAEIAIESK